MSIRHDKVGIQRELHPEWFEHAAAVYAAGITKAAARLELYSYLDNAVGFASSPSEQSKTYIANALIKTWIAPEKELTALRDAAHRFLNSNPVCRQAIHWALLCAAYPFWFNVASCVGRLLNLQDQVTQAQIVLRLKEKYGDRQTVSRRARYVIRSFVVWGVLKDSEVKGCYEKVAPVCISDQDSAILLLEAALHATPGGKAALGLLLNNPAFFPFQLPVMTGDFVAQRTDHIDVVRYGLDEELLKLKGK
jgi:hypothetical protein